MGLTFSHRLKLAVCKALNRIVAAKECDLPAGRQAQRCLIELQIPGPKKNKKYFIKSLLN